MEIKDFRDLPGGEEITPELKPKVKRIETPADMLERMGLSFKDETKPNAKEFFELAIKKCGYMSEGVGKVVIPMLMYQKTFMEYFKLKGSKGKEEFNDMFNKMQRRGELGFISLKYGKETLLFLPRDDELL